jgi:HEAT repeat protein
MKSLLVIRPYIKIVFALLVFVSVAYGQDIAKLEKFMQSTKANTASMQIFREGRDQIEAQNWQRAAEKFNEFIKGYPKDKDLDAALYWYGYALHKQGRTDDAAAPLVRLIERYPNSSWRQEAQALLVTLGRKADVDQALARDNCEIKILALQSLFQADEDRAVQIVTDALKANTTPCQGFQAAALTMLGRHGGTRAYPILLDIARNNTADLKLRLTAIRYLGDQRNEQITGELVRIYDADKTKEIRYQVLRALADREDAAARAKVLEIARQGETPELRIMAIRVLSDHGRMGLDELLQLYNGETNVQIKQGLLRTFADNKDPRAVAKLLDVARGSDPIELRGYAIRQLGDRDDEQTVTQLVGLYDGEQNLQVKAVLIRAFGNSKQKVAVRKLMTIARNDSSVEMRKTAVRYLGESKDPEALKFLEDLLK